MTKILRVLAGALFCALVGCHAPDPSGAGSSSTSSSSSSSSSGACPPPAPMRGTIGGALPVANPAAATTGTIVSASANPTDGAQNMHSTNAFASTYCFGATLSADGGATTLITIDGGLSQGICPIQGATANTGTAACSTSDPHIDGGAGPHQGYLVAAGVTVNLLAGGSQVVVTCADSSGDSVYGCCQ